MFDRITATHIAANIEGGSRLAEMRVWVGLQSQYDALVPPDPNTIYLVTA